jgi:hypothetical protein
MPLSRLQGKRRIAVGLVLAVAVSAAWLGWSRRVTEPIVRGGQASVEPFVQVTGAKTSAVDRILQERADYFDPAPLFIPTPRNFASRGLPESLVRQPGQVFRDFGGKFNFGEGGLSAYGADVALSPESVVEVLGQVSEAPFAGLGRARWADAPPPARAAVMVFIQMVNNGLNFEEVLKVSPPRADFAPLEFLLAVAADGLIGDPLLITGSGRPEVDAFFQEQLLKREGRGQRLPPGRYRVLIGP